MRRKIGGKLVQNLISSFILISVGLGLADAGLSKMAPNQVSGSGRENQTEQTKPEAQKNNPGQKPEDKTQNNKKSLEVGQLASAVLDQLEVKGRAPKTGYKRDMFGQGWAEFNNHCNTRNEILKRDLVNVTVDNKCRVISGVLIDPYTAKTIQFVRGEKTSSQIQIDHVVALSNAWQTGAQNLPLSTRTQFANDPLNLLAVDGAANQQKSDSDAASWLPKNKSFRCPYVARQITIKQKYDLWVTAAEKQTMQNVLKTCPDQEVILEN